MTRLLHIEASPRKKRSSSIEIAHAYIDAFLKKHPGAEVVTLDLWDKELPAFDGDTIDAKYAVMHGHALTEAERKSWRIVESLIRDFKEADHYLFSLPMWNFGIPYILKHYLDIIVQPSYTFSYSPTSGYEGLIKGKSAHVIYARGGRYGEGSGLESLDLQKRYMETILAFIGFESIQSIVVEPTMLPADQKAQVMEKARLEAISLAKTL